MTARRVVAATDWFSDGQQRTSLRQRAVRGVVVSLGSNVGTKLVRFASMAVLARLLVPEDFGLVAMLSAVVGAASLLKDMGLPSATLRFPRISHASVTQLFWINQLAGLVWMLLVMLGAPLLATFFNDPRLVSAAWVLALSLPFEAACAQHQALLRRAHGFRKLALITLAKAISTALLSIMLARAGYQFWALIWGVLGGHLVALILTWWCCSWRPGGPRQGREGAELVQFGVRMLGFNLLGFCALNLHNVLVGRLWGAAAVGQYSRAATLHALTLGGVTEPSALVIPASMARLSETPQRLCNFYYKACALVVSMALPVAFVGLVLPQEFIALLLGDQWDQAAHIFQLLSIGVVPQVISNSTGWVYLSVGNPKLMLWWGLIGWTGFIVGIAVGAWFGILGIALGASLANTLLLVPGLLFAFRGTPLRLWPLCSYVAKPIAAGACAAVLAWGALQAVQTQAEWLRFGVGLGTFCAVYAALSLGIPSHRSLILGTLQELRAGRSSNTQNVA